MATYQNTNAQPFGAVVIYRTVNALENAAANLAAWSQSRATKKELSKLTSRELADIGLTRGDIQNF